MEPARACFSVVQAIFIQIRPSCCLPYPSPPGVAHLHAGAMPASLLCAPEPPEVQGAGRRGVQLGRGEPGQREGPDSQAEAADQETLLLGVEGPGAEPVLEEWGQGSHHRLAQGRAEWRRGSRGEPYPEGVRRHLWVCHDGRRSGVAQEGAAGDAGCGPPAGTAADAAARADPPAEGGAGLPPAQGDAGRCHLRPGRLRGGLGPALQHPTQSCLPPLHTTQAHRRHPHEH